MNSTDPLLPPNATRRERALVRAGARATDLDVPIRELWSVADCPERLLPWLAWALSLQTWRPEWPVAVKRARIRSAIDIHRRRGTASSVRAVVESFGADLALREWWQTSPRGTPHTFTVTLSVGQSLPQTQEFQNDIQREIELARPERSHFSLVAATQAQASVGVLAAARAITYRRLNLMD